MNSLPADHKYQLCTELTRKTVCFILYLWLRSLIQQIGPTFTAEARILSQRILCGICSR